MKAQMKFQKILSLVTVIIAALSVVLSLFFCSGVMFHAQKYVTAAGFKNKNDIKADALINYSQHINNLLVIMAIVFVVVVLTLYITATNKRRNYYITNYVAMALVAVYAIVFAAILIVVCAKCLDLAGQIDYKKWKQLYNVPVLDDDTGLPVGFKNPRNYSENKSTIILGFVLAGVILADVAVWVLNLVWKIKLMQGEKALLAQGVHMESEVA